MPPEDPRFTLEFWQDDHGDMPVLRWIREDLNAGKRRLLGTAMSKVLQELGPAVCESEWGKQLGSGLFEFRCRGDRGLLMRVYCHAYGKRVVLLLAGYDKGVHPSRSFESRQIGLARRRLVDWLDRQRRAVKSTGPVVPSAGLRDDRPAPRRARRC